MYTEQYKDINHIMYVNANDTANKRNKNIWERECHVYPLQ